MLSMAPACRFRSRLEERSLIELSLATQRRAVPQTMALQGVEEFQTRRKKRPSGRRRICEEGRTASCGGSVGESSAM